MIATLVPNPAEADGAPGSGAITSNLTFYVRKGGSDSNTGVSTGSPFLTVQKALNTLAALVIPVGITVTVDVGAGVFSESVAVYPFPGGGSVVISGAGSSSTTLLAVVAIVPNVTVRRMTLSGGGYTVQAWKTGVISVGTDIVVGTATNAHFMAYEGGTVLILNSYTVTGNATYHYQALRFGILRAFSATGAIGTRTFTVFAHATINGLIESGSMTYTGSVTAQRYNGSLLSNIYTTGGGDSYFPGNVAGAVTTSAIYG